MLRAIAARTIFIFYRLSPLDNPWTRAVCFFIVNNRKNHYSYSFGKLLKHILNSAQSLTILRHHDSAKPVSVLEKC